MRDDNEYRDDSEELGGGALVVTETPDDTTPPTDTQILALHPDPAKIGWPPTLPVELALGNVPSKYICEQHGISKEQFVRLTQVPAFQKAFADAREMLLKESVSFRAKARLQSEMLLPESWRLIHSQYTPANVKAKLIEATWRVAGFEPKNTDVASGNNLQINIHLA